MIMNPLIPAAIILLMFLSPLSTVTAFVLDVEGEPLINGESYFVVPKGCGGGLTLTHKAETPPCPLYITRKATSPSISVQISSPLRILYVPVSANVKFVFNGNMTTCTEELLEWRVTPDLTTRQSYVVAGGTSLTTAAYSFTIEEANTEEKKFVYKIRYCPSFEGGDEKNCGDVGFFRKNGLLGVTNEKPLYVQFQKANA